MSVMLIVASVHKSFVTFKCFFGRSRSSRTKLVTERKLLTKLSNGDGIKGPGFENKSEISCGRDKRSFVG